jgi:hypothetical protein
MTWTGCTSKIPAAAATAYLNTGAARPRLALQAKAMRLPA